MKNLNLDQLKKLVLAVLLIVIGILFCCSLAMGINGLSTVVGFILLVIGILFISYTLINHKNALTTNGIIGVIILTLGILFTVHKLAGLIFTFIPWFLIVFGSVIIIDALLGKFLRKDDNLTIFIIKIVIGIISIILGICLRTIDRFAEYASVMLGILMIVYSVYIIFTIFISKENHTQIQ